MIFALAKFSALVKQFNRRRLTERDFFKICKQYKINVGYADMPILKGFHTTVHGEITIWLDKKLKGYEFVFIAFHELAHVFLHESTEPIAINFFNQIESKHENEAEAVGLMALFPTKTLKNLEDELCADDDYYNFLIRKRILIGKEVNF